MWSNSRNVSTAVACLRPPRYTTGVRHAIESSEAAAYPKELAECGVVRLAWLALDIFLTLVNAEIVVLCLFSYQVFCEPES